MSLQPKARAAADGLPGYAIVPLSNMGRANQACIRVKINGQSTMLMLDTGAYATVLDSHFYHGVQTKPGNVNPDELPPQLRQSVSTNGVKAEAGYIDNMTSSAMNFGKGPVVVADLSRQLDGYNNYHHSLMLADCWARTFSRSTRLWSIGGGAGCISTPIRASA